MIVLTWIFAALVLYHGIVLGGYFLFGAGIGPFR